MILYEYKGALLATSCFFLDKVMVGSIRCNECEHQISDTPSEGSFAGGLVECARLNAVNDILSP